ncbi:uncharacterized protein LOC108141300 [Drosophila elegans]|uniref:uncharacterized protein LOC108141300 n=1 Tax=Drosophila elegans TaxID=30023 RepID=UPI0007E7D872|nr:uncharacterized protein LOC108141300 [Drosophila elegans]
MWHPNNYYWQHQRADVRRNFHQYPNMSACNYSMQVFYRIFPQRRPYYFYQQPVNYYNYQHQAFQYNFQEQCFTTPMQINPHNYPQLNEISNHCSIPQIRPSYCSYASKQGNCNRCRSPKNRLCNCSCPSQQDNSSQQPKIAANEMVASLEIASVENSADLGGSGENDYSGALSQPVVNEDLSKKEVSDCANYSRSKPKDEQEIRNNLSDDEERKSSEKNYPQKRKNSEDTNPTYYLDDQEIRTNVLDDEESKSSEKKNESSVERVSDDTGWINSGKETASPVENNEPQALEFDFYQEDEIVSSNFSQVKPKLQKPQDSYPIIYPDDRKIETNGSEDKEWISLKKENPSSIQNVNESVALGSRENASPASDVDGQCIYPEDSVCLDFQLPARDIKATLNLKERFEMQLVKVCSPHNFKIWIYDEKIHDYWVLSCNMQTFYESQDMKTYTIPESLIALNHLCVVRSCNSGVWERAKVVRHQPTNIMKTIDVKLLDTGDIMCVSYGDVKFLKKEFAVLPPLCLHGRLAYIVPWKGSTWSSSVSAYFFSLIRYRRLLAKIEAIKDNVAYLVLVDPLINSPIKNINKMLIHSGWARRCFTP